MSLSNSQHEALMREYNRTQLYHENLRRTHEAEIYEKIPRIKEIDDEVKSSGHFYAKRNIRGEGFSKDEFLKYLEGLRAEKLSLLKRNGYPENYMELTYTCEKCHDTGYIDGRKCSCYLQAATNLLYNQSGLAGILEKENFDTLTFEYYSRDEKDAFRGRTVFDNMTHVVDACKKYVAEFPDKKGSLFFTGQAGCGKTFLSHCIAKALMDQRISVVYVTAKQLFDLFAEETFNRDKDANASLTQYIFESDLLIIDDLGTEVSNSFTNSSFFSCVNERLVKGKGTIISTNLSLANIRDKYSDRIYSRILGNYTCFSFYGPDIRIAKRYS